MELLPGLMRCSIKKKNKKKLEEARDFAALKEISEPPLGQGIYIPTRKVYVYVHI